MATAATSLLGLALPVTGELSGTWGDTVNVSITALLDSAVAGTTTLSSDADVTLTTTTLAANQARQAIILWTAGGTVTRTITAPAQSKSYIVINKTSSSQSIKIVGAGPTTGVTIVAGTAAFVVWNGVDFVTASVTSTTGILPVANGGTGLSSGTSGGVLAYTATGTLASSAALAASALVIGGGAGAAPSTTTTGTGVVTALGVNTGTAGAFVVNGGALGSPSTAGTMPAFTLGGTVSGGGNQINNVVIGTSTPLAGAFTTLSASAGLTSVGGVSRFSRADTTPAGTANTIADDGVFGSTDTANAGITIFNTNEAGIYFGDAAANAQGQIRFQHSTNKFEFSTNSGASIQTAIDSTGLAVTGAISATTTITASGTGGATAINIVDATSNLQLGLTPGTGGDAYISNKRVGSTIRVRTSSATESDTTPLVISSTGLAVTGTLSATGNINIAPTTTTNNAVFIAGNAGGTFFAGLDSSTGGSFGVGNYSSVLYNGANTPMVFFTNGTERMRINAAGGLTVTGTLSGGTSGTGYSFSGTAPATSLTLDSSGNLGLGVTPSAWNTGGAGPALQVNYASISQAGGFDVSNFATNAYLVSGVGYKYIGSAAATMYQQNAGAHAWFSAASGTAGNAISFTQAMTLDASGNLGIGATTPSTYGKLVVSGGGFTQLATTALPAASGSTRSDFTRILDSAGSRALDSSISSTGAWIQSRDKNDYSVNYDLFLQPNGGNLLVGTTNTGLGKLNVGGTISTSLSSGGTFAISYTTANASSRSWRMANDVVAYGDFAIQQSTTQAGSTFATQLLIDSSGNLLAGTTSTPAINVKGCAFQSFSDQGRLAIGATVSTADLAYFYSSTALAGAINVNGSVCLYSSFSDQRLKENITDADSASSLIDALQVRKFDWKADGNHQRYGFIAQELVTVAPEAVHQPLNPDDMMAVDYSKLVPMLVKEIQSLRARVAQLESKP